MCLTSLDPEDTIAIKTFMVSTFLFLESSSRDIYSFVYFYDLFIEVLLVYNII